MFGALALVPLIAVTVIVSTFVSRDQTVRVDGRLGAAIGSGVDTYHALLNAVGVRARTLAARPDVQRALAGHGDPATVVALHPRMQLKVHGRVIAGVAPSGPAWRAHVQVGPASVGREVVVWQPLGPTFMATIATQYSHVPGVELDLIAGHRVIAGTGGATGSESGLRVGRIGNATVAGVDVRGQMAAVDSAQGGPVYLAATYPSSTLSDAIDSRRLRLLVPVLIVGGLLTLLAVVAARRISRSLTELAVRARSLLRTGTGTGGGDELSELGAVIDHMSTELTTRVDELEAERTRVKETLQRYGATLAATHDLDALVGAVLDTAVQATRARGGRLLLYEPLTGEAVERARIGTALGSRADLPMVVSAGSGIEGLALAEMAPRSEQTPRAVLAAPIVREDELLGLVTVVDPQDGAFEGGDVEALAGLAAQAGVAIENARLHEVVEQQAVTDALTGLANRRQFYDVLGREFERAQRFDQQIGLILFDIDDFKQVNDTLGHLAGDVVLHAVSETLLELIREIDLAARYGGEEFAVLLPQTGLEGAVNLAHRLRLAVEEREIVFAGAPVTGITASFGVSAGPEEGTTQIDLVAAADAALYRAKRSGKNQVVPE